MTKSVARTKARAAKRAIIKNFRNVKANVWTLHLSYNNKDARFIEEFFANNAHVGNRSALGRHTNSKGSVFELILIAPQASGFKTKRAWRKAVQSDLRFAQSA